jgi:hypothetical protein
MKRILEVCLMVGVSVGVGAVMVYANECLTSLEGNVTISKCLDDNHPPTAIFSDPYGSVLFANTGTIGFGDLTWNPPYEGNGLPRVGAIVGDRAIPFDCNGGAQYTMTTLSTGAVVSAGDTGAIVVGNYTNPALAPDGNMFTGVYCGATSSVEAGWTRARMRVAAHGGESNEDEPFTAFEVLDNNGTISGSVGVLGSDDPYTDIPAKIEISNASEAKITVDRDGSVIIQLGSTEAAQNRALSQGAEVAPAGQGLDARYIMQQLAGFQGSLPVTP